ncbi:MAG TPA: Lrp/AsnC family transcriptional regulator [Firmicutes bacterium]|nr:Lrp/AsnC family transcriptional regulator [Bacillota bacterium]
MFYNTDFPRGVGMDQYDLEILALLRENARITHSDLSHHIHLSVPAVSERVRKLEHQGYIKKFTALISAKKFGKTLLFFSTVTLEHPRHADKFLHAVKYMPEILECHHVTGEGDYLLKIVTDDTAAMERIIYALRCIEGVQRTKTTVVLSTVKEEPCIKIAGK